MKFVVLILLFAVTSSVQAVRTEEDKKRIAIIINYSNCSAYFHFMKDQEKKAFFNEHGWKLVGGKKTSEKVRRHLWKRQEADSKMALVASQKGKSFDTIDTTILTEKYGEKCNSIYTGKK